ncbi:MAG: SHOCT domain-containing protein [Rhodospirillales bacterium]
MKDQPLTSSDSLKLLIFAVITIVTALALVGILPALFILFSIYMTSKTENFSHIDTMVKFLKTVFIIGISVISVYGIFGFIHFYSRAHEYNPDIKSYSMGSVKFAWEYTDEIQLSIIVSMSLVLYVIALQCLFHAPLKRHSTWIEQNPIFFKRTKFAKRAPDDLELNIIKGEKLKQYSVADELLKWAKLKDDGHISEAEFQEARQKLLKKT